MKGVWKGEAIMIPMSEQDEKSLASLEELLRRRICSVCVDRNTDGTCSLSQQQECGLFGHFPKIVRAISRVQSDRIDDYIRAIREDVCSECVKQRLDGSCELRTEVRCVLDRYLLLIVGAIEETRGISLQGGIVH